MRAFISALYVFVSVKAASPAQYGAFEHIVLGGQTISSVLQPGNNLSDVTTPAAALHNIGGDNGYNIFYVPPGTGGTSRDLGDVLAAMGDVRGYGAKCDGVTDDGPAINRTLATNKTALINGNGCSGAFIVNTSIVLPGKHALIWSASGTSQTAQMVTNANVDTVVVTGDSYSIENANVTHNGNGKILSLGNARYGEVVRPYLAATMASATSPLIYLKGSETTITSARLTNNRTNGQALTVDSTGGVSAIINRINDLTVGGNGPGVLVQTSDNTNRPEGVYLNQFHYIGSVNAMLVTQVNGLYVTNSTFDIGSGISFKPVGQGINNVEITGGYISTPSALTTGVCVNIDGSAVPASNIGHLDIKGTQFSYCGYGIVSQTAGALGSMTVSGAQMSNVANAYALTNVTGTVSIGGGSQYTAMGNNGVFSDGAGGKFVFGDNFWDVGKSISTTQATPANWIFGDGNVGVKLAGTAAATTGTIGAAGCSALAIPHGLVSAPNIDKVTITPRVVSGSMSVTASVVSVDATNVNVSVCAPTWSSAGTVRVVERSSL